MKTREEILEAVDIYGTVAYVIGYININDPYARDMFLLSIELAYRIGDRDGYKTAAEELSK